MQPVSESPDQHMAARSASLLLLQQQSVRPSAEAPHTVSVQVLMLLCSKLLSCETDDSEIRNPLEVIS